MKVHHIPSSQIIFTKCAYPTALAESMERIGIVFPLRLRWQNDSYVCLDGHKRLSVLAALKKETEVPALIENDGSMRTQGSWHFMNHH